MTVSNCQVRRATVDDLVMLRRLWQQGQLPVAALEKRLTEFQIVETAAGEVLGAVGLRVAQHQGEIHSEAYKEPALAEELRPRLWERIQSVARSQALTRLWVGDATSLFWLERGFEPAGSELLGRHAEALGDQADQSWLTLKLREEAVEGTSLEAEFELFRLAQQAETERIARRARWLRWIAATVVMAVLILLGVAAAYILGHGKPGRTL
jgi:N-acetylglutamate synthase-like GNAT family acetyltransferase